MTFLMFAVKGDPFLYQTIVEAGFDSALQVSTIMSDDSVRFCCAVKLYVSTGASEMKQELEMIWKIKLYIGDIIY